MDALEIVPPGNSYRRFNLFSVGDDHSGKSLWHIQISTTAITSPPGSNARPAWEFSTAACIIDAAEARG